MQDDQARPPAGHGRWQRRRRLSRGCLPVVSQEQASWVCRCEDRVVQRLEQDFKVTLQQQNSLEQWAAWLDGVVSQVLKPYQGSAGFPKAAKLFLLKWSFYRCALARPGAGGKGVERQEAPSIRAGP